MHEPPATAPPASRTTLLPLVLGVAVVVVALVGPPAVAAVLGSVAAAIAGWACPEAPVRVGTLVLAPQAATALVRTLAGGASWGILAFALVGGLMWSLIGSHLGAGVALRRRGEHG